jgi:hypothetical protein
VEATKDRRDWSYSLEHSELVRQHISQFSSVELHISYSYEMLEYAGVGEARTRSSIPRFMLMHLLACSLDLGQNQRNLSPGHLLRKQMIPLKCPHNDVHASAAKAVVQPFLRNLNRRRGRRHPYHRLTLVQR